MTTRRRMLTILAGGALLPVIGQAAATPAPAQWRGIALGADAQIILDHPDADALIRQAVAEIERLEGIFSLYRDSQLTRLNRQGRLDDPAFEMVELLSICDHLNTRTGGAFDPAIQPLWALYAESFAAGTSPDDGQLAEARLSSGWGNLRFDASEVAFTQQGSALTLNGVAQGYIADKIAAMFRSNGVENVLVNTGEIMAVGSAPDSKAWPVKLRDRTGKLPLRNQAVATSAPLGTTFDQGGKVGHIIDPRSGKPAGRWPQISVVARSAALADGFSTAFCLMDREEIAAARTDAVIDVIL